MPRTRFRQIAPHEVTMTCDDPVTGETIVRAFGVTFAYVVERADGIERFVGRGLQVNTPPLLILQDGERLIDALRREHRRAQAADRRAFAAAAKALERGGFLT